MALVVFLRGANVGGHRTFRPRVLAKQLRPFDVVNVGAAGTFVIRNKVGRAELRAALLRQLPFQAHIMICNGRDILRLAADDPFLDHPSEPDIVQFVSVLAKRRPVPASFPLDIPANGDWYVRVLGFDGRFVVGLHRRAMKAIRYLGELDEIFGVGLTTRSWNTILTVERILRGR